MKIRSITLIPPGLMVILNVWEEECQATAILDVKGYGVTENGRVCPLVEDEQSGDLVPIGCVGEFVRTYREGGEDD